MCAGGIYIKTTETPIVGARINFIAVLLRKWPR
jgi:hypothetical protein